MKQDKSEGLLLTVLVIGFALGLFIYLWVDWRIQQQEDRLNWHREYEEHRSHIQWHKQHGDD